MPETQNQNLLEYIRVLLRWKRFILTLVGITATASVIVSLLLPLWYRSEAILLVPEQPFGFGFTPNMSSLTDLPLASLSTGRLTRDSRRIIAILESRTMMESVIQAFDLQTEYERKTLQETVKDLQGNLDIDIEDEGTISIAAVDKSPQQAADIVTHMVRELERRNMELNISAARLTRIFIEEQFEKNKLQLHQTEESYLAFTKEHHVIALPAQTEAAIEAVAALQADIVKQEIQVNVMRRMLGSEHPEFVKSRDLLTEQQKRLKQMIFAGEQVAGNVAAGEETRLFVPFQEVPNVGLDLMRFERDLTIQNEIHGLLTQFYEQAKVQEAKDTPSIQVLDAPVIAEKKYKPKRSLIVLAFTVASLFASVGAAFTIEYLRRIRSAL